MFSTRIFLSTFSSYFDSKLQVRHVRIKIRPRKQCRNCFLYSFSKSLMASSISPLVINSFTFSNCSMGNMIPFLPGLSLLSPYICVEEKRRRESLKFRWLLRETENIHTTTTACTDLTNVDIGRSLELQHRQATLVGELEKRFAFFVLFGFSFRLFRRGFRGRLAVRRHVC